LGHRNLFSLDQAKFKYAWFIGTTENAVINQLFAVFIAYVLLHWLYKQTKSSISKPNLLSMAFQHMLLTSALPLSWWDQMVLFLITILIVTGQVCLNLVNQQA